MKYLVLAFAFSASLAHGECRLYYATKGDLAGVKLKNENIRTVSKSINNALKSSFDFLNKIDHYTLGLASAVLLGGPSLEDIKPVEWDRLVIGGRLIHQNSPFDAVPIRGARITFKDEKRHTDKVTFIDEKYIGEATTGPDGEFSQSFHEIMSYKRFRLFPAPTFTITDKYIRTAKIPLIVKVESKVCTAETRLTEVPFEPLILIASDND